MNDTSLYAILRRLVKRFKQILTNPSGTNIGFSIFASNGFFPDLSSEPEKIVQFRPSSLRLSNKSSFQIADPFIVSVDDQLFCFFETKSLGMPGKISVLTSDDSGGYSIADCELGISSHISFPFIFYDDVDSKLYMLPETSAEREVAVYETVTFPHKWEKKKALLKGNYVDSHLIKHENIFYLFTTEKVVTSRSNYFDYQLKLYTSDYILGEYIPHPVNPICTGRRFSRSAGAVIAEGNALFRVAQDCTTAYGRELSVIQITKLTPREYEEKLVTENWISKIFGHKAGGHHVSCAILAGKRYLAVDFNFTDSYLQRFVNPFLK